MNSSFFDVDSGDVSRSGRVRKRSSKLVNYDPMDEDPRGRKERRDSGHMPAKRKTKVMVTPSQQYDMRHEVLDVKSEMDDDISEPEDDLQGYEVDGYTSDVAGDAADVKPPQDHHPALRRVDQDDEHLHDHQSPEGDMDDDDFSNLIMVANDDDDDSDDADDDEDDDDDDDGDRGQFSDDAEDPLVIDESAMRSAPQASASGRGRGKAAKQPKMARKTTGQRRNASKMWKQQRMTRKDKGLPRITAYLLWAREVRDSVVQGSPDLDFSEVNKRLGAMWHALPDAKKYNFKRKAQRINSRAMVKQGESTSAKMKSTGKGRGRGRGRGAAPPADSPSEPAAPEAPGKQPSMPPSSLSEATSLVNPTNYRVCTTQPLDLAAHMVLLGESLGVIGQKLRDHDGQIAVSGSLSVLLDSLLCALVPLVALTKQVPELDGCDDRDLIKILDNIAYFMPGL